MKGRLALLMAIAAGLTPSSSYTANAADFDGTNDYALRGADFEGNAADPQGIFSCWLRLDGGDGADQALLSTTATHVHIARHGSNKIRFSLEDTSGTSSLTFQTLAGYTASATWRHILASWDTNFSAGNKVVHLYVNDSSDKDVLADAAAAFDIDYPESDYSVGAVVGGSTKINGCLADLYFAPGQFLDFSVTANRRKFISAAGKPVNLGKNGKNPTGVAPILYLRRPYANWHENQGTGGGMTVTGSLDRASTSPSA